MPPHRFSALSERQREMAGILESSLLAVEDYESGAKGE